VQENSPSREPGGSELPVEQNNGETTLILGRAVRAASDSNHAEANLFLASVQRPNKRRTVVRLRTRTEWRNLIRIF